MKEEINAEVEMQKKKIKRQEFISWIESIKKESLEALRKEKINRPNVRVKVPKGGEEKDVDPEKLVIVDEKLFQKAYLNIPTPIDREYTFKSNIDGKLFEKVNVPNVRIPNEYKESEFVFDGTLFNGFKVPVFTKEKIDFPDKNDIEKVSEINGALFDKVENCVIMPPQKTDFVFDAVVINEKCNISVPANKIHNQSGIKFNAEDFLSQYISPCVQDMEVWRNYVNFEFSAKVNELQAQTLEKISKEQFVKCGFPEVEKPKEEILANFKVEIDESRFTNKKLYANNHFEGKEIDIPEFTVYKLDKEISNLTCPARETIFDVLDTI